MFTVTGLIDSTERTVSWDDGAFDGDPTVLGRIGLLIGPPAANVRITVPNPWMAAAADDPVAAYATALSIFDRVTSVDGDVPAYDPTGLADPAGAVY